MSENRTHPGSRPGQAFSGPCSGSIFSCAFLSTVVLLGGIASALALDFPALTGRVVDQANVIPADVEATLTAQLSALEAETGRQAVVVTLPDLQGTTIEDFGFQLGRDWGIGRAEDNDGVLLIVAPNDRAVRIEVGYGLEGIMTDALSRVIIDRAILPKFRTGDLPGGITDGVADIISVLSDDSEALESRRIAIPAKDPVDSAMIWLMVLFHIGIWGFVLWNIIDRIRNPEKHKKRMKELAKRRRASGWSSGGFSGRSSGGFSGGFSGGGGSFGGGGASGSW